MKQFTVPSPQGIRTIGAGHPCFIVAEVSCNHQQNIEKAREIIRAAANAGADAVKLQTYTPDTITLDVRNEYFLLGGENNPDSWKQKTLYELYGMAYTPWEWHAELQKLAESLGLLFFSSPFDETAVDFLENLNVPLFKIASYEMTHIPLLKKVAATGKPVIMSVGFNTRDETMESVAALRESNCNDIALLHCINTYADDLDYTKANLSTIRDLTEQFDVVAGFSDNNAGIALPILAAAAGASIIEKHLVVSHNDETFDKRFSLDPVELAELVTTVRKNESAMGRPHYGPVDDAEAYNLRLRRSIFADKDIAVGEKFTRKNIRVVRPAFGLEPKHFESIMGKVAASKIQRGTPLNWSHIQKS